MLIKFCLECKMMAFNPPLLYSNTKWQHWTWLRQWLGADGQQVITWVNVDLSSAKSSNTHLRVLLPSITKISFKITPQKFKSSQQPMCKHLSFTMHQIDNCYDFCCGGIYLLPPKSLNIWNGTKHYALRNNINLLLFMGLYKLQEP